MEFIKKNKIFSTIVAAILLLVVFTLTSQFDDTNDSASPSNNTISNQTNTTTTESANSEQANTQTVSEVVDGDTIKLTSGDTVRVVGIDTPETVDPRTTIQCFGKEASNKMKELVNGKIVTLIVDTIGDSVDKYDRQLRYISLDGVDIGAKMIEEGYAYAYTTYPHSRNTVYVALQEQAKAEKRGLWADNTCAGNANTNTTVSATNTNTTTPIININSTISEPEPEPATPEPEPATSPTCNCSTDLDCGDFSTHAEAQALYDCCMEQVGRDFHGLDGNDNDGLACESLP